MNLMIFYMYHLKRKERSTIQRSTSGSQSCNNRVTILVFYPEKYPGWIIVTRVRKHFQMGYDGAPGRFDD
jgi:hypothetical protein